MDYDFTVVKKNGGNDVVWVETIDTIAVIEKQVMLHLYVGGRAPPILNNNCHL